MTAAAWPQGYRQAQASPLAQTLHTFSTETGVTYANSGTAATQTLDSDSPFGATRLRVDAPSGNTWTEVQLHSISVPLFTDGNTVYFRIWLKDWNAITQIQVFAGVTSYTRLAQNTFSIQNSDRNNRNGPITIPLNSYDTTSNTFTWGTDTLGSVKIRVFARSGFAPRFWVDSFGVGYRSRPQVLLTFDDASQSWIDYVQPALVARGIKATFGVGTGQVGTNEALYVSTADLLSLQSDGHQLCAHNVTNTAYDLTSAGVATYMAEYDAAVASLQSWGINGPFNYHPFVQGKNDQALITTLASRGVKVMRGVNTLSATVPRLNYPGCGTYSDNITSINVASHGSGLSLANARTALGNLLKYGGTYCAMFHEIVDAVPAGTEWANSDFTAWLDDLVAYRNLGLLDVGMTVDKWYRGLTQPALVA